MEGAEIQKRITEMKTGPLARLEAKCAKAKMAPAAMAMVDELLSISSERDLSLLVLVVCKLANGLCEQVIERPGGEIGGHYEEEACDYALQFAESALALEMMTMPLGMVFSMTTMPKADFSKVPC